jgi:hypothetical protein
MTRLADVLASVVVVGAIAGGALGACGGDSANISPDAAAPLDSSIPDAAPPDVFVPPSPANVGWIGGACDDPSDCVDVADPLCFTPVDGFPNGTCSMTCTGLCPDRGQPGDTLTFCIDAIPVGLDEGMCVSRCDVALLGGDGCPAGYRCVPRNRYADPDVVIDVCLPDVPAPACAASDELIPIAYPDSGALWIPAEAQCGGPFDLVVLLHGINPSSNPTPSLGGGRHLEIETRALIDADLVAPVVLAEPVHFQGSSTLLYSTAAGFDLRAHLDLVLAELDRRGITVQSISYTGHSGAGCDPSNGLYLLLAELDLIVPSYAPSLRLWGLQDVCYEAAYHWQAPIDALSGADTVLFNMYSVQGDPTAFEDNLFPSPDPLPCRDALYTDCMAHPSEPWMSLRTRSTAGITHDNNPWFFVREVFPRVFAP